MVTCCCPVCGCGPIRVVHLYRHLRSAHNWTEEQIDEEEMAMKAKTLAQKGNHKCGACDKTFVNDQGCSRHWKVAHKGVQRFSGNYVVCPSCQQKFQNSAQLVKHWREEHEQEEDQSVDPNFVLAFLNRTLRQLDCMERRNQPLISNPGWRWRGKKKVSKVPQVQEKEVHDPTQVPQVQMKEVHDSSAGELLFDSAVKQEAPGPSHVPSQSGSELQMADEGHSDDSSGSSDQSGDGQMLGTSRRSRSSETPEEEAARRRFKAERERIRRYQTKLLKEKQRDMAIHAYEAMRNAPPHVAQAMWRTNVGQAPQNVAVQKTQKEVVSQNVTVQKPQKESVSSSKLKAACYALVGLSSESERQRFVDVAVSNGFCDLMFMKGPIGNALDGVQLLYLNTSGVAPRPQEKAATKVEVNDQSEISVQGEQESSCNSQSNDAGEVIVIPTNERSVEQMKNFCVVCGVKAQTDDVRLSSDKRQENIVLFACLRAQNCIDVEAAKRMLKVTDSMSVPICHDHYIQAADYIGKEVELMSGIFPENGFNDVPSIVGTDLLSFIQVYANHLGDDTTLAFDDVSCFLRECLAKYYNKKSWGSQEKKSTTFFRNRVMQEKISSNLMRIRNSEKNSAKDEKKKETTVGEFLSRELLGKRSAEETSCPPNTLPSALDAVLEDGIPHKKPKQEINEDSGQITAMDLLEPSVSEEPSPADSVVVINPSSTDSKDSIPTSSADSQQQEGEHKKSPDEKEMVADPYAVEVRDQSSLVDTLNDEDFWNYFRITRKTFATLCSTLETMDTRLTPSISCSTAVKVATTLEVLAGVKQSSVGFTPAKVGLIFDNVLAALAEWSTTIVQWPDDRERRKISDKFFDMTGLRGIVGCIDGTIIKGIQGINVGVVADDRKQFRWVFAKFRAHEDDESVFKQSLLCRQLRDGRRKGILIGDDAYKKERFLLTPSKGKDVMSEKDFAMATTLRIAHVIVQEAIANWKRQFPILKETIRSARIARIVVCCAALYNLSRAENEPVFENKDDVAADEAEEHCITIAD